MQRVPGRAPPKSDAGSKDETYLNLLSSQRRLLNQISAAGLPTASCSGQRSPKERRNAAIGGELTVSHNRMNRSISEPPPNEFPYNKISSTSPDRLVDPVSSASSCLMPPFETKQSGSEIGNDGDVKVTKPPSLGLSLSFLDNLQSRRGSMASHREDVHLYDPDGRLDDGNEEDDDDLSSIEPLEFKYDQEPAFLVKEITSLDGAMAKSQDSQQTIHDWDKKMGLKRSHSKTMRLSSRSRKKVRALLKRELSSLSQRSSGTSREGG